MAVPSTAQSPKGQNWYEVAETTFGLPKKLVIKEGLTSIPVSEYNFLKIYGNICIKRKEKKECACWRSDGSKVGKPRS